MVKFSIYLNKRVFIMQGYFVLSETHKYFCEELKKLKYLSSSFSYLEVCGWIIYLGNNMCETLVMLGHISRVMALGRKFVSILYLPKQLK